MLALAAQAPKAIALILIGIFILLIVKIEKLTDDEDAQKEKSKIQKF